MEAATMTREESLLVIQQMINTAKNEQKDDGKGRIVWGWLLVAASVCTFVNLRTGWLNPYFFWNALVACTVALTKFVFFKKETDGKNVYRQFIRTAQRCAGRFYNTRPYCQ